MIPQSVAPERIRQSFDVCDCRPDAGDLDAIAGPHAGGGIGARPATFPST